jgi:hypothetical protein
MPLGSKINYEHYQIASPDGQDLPVSIPVLVGNTHVSLTWLKKSSNELKAVFLEIL